MLHMYIVCKKAHVYLRRHHDLNAWNRLQGNYQFWVENEYQQKLLPMWIFDLMVKAVSSSEE